MEERETGSESSSLLQHARESNRSPTALRKQAKTLKIFINE